MSIPDQLKLRDSDTNLIITYNDDGLLDNNLLHGHGNYPLHGYYETTLVSRAVNILAAQHLSRQQQEKQQQLPSNHTPFKTYIQCITVMIMIVEIVLAIKNEIISQLPVAIIEQQQSL